MPTIYPPFAQMAFLAVAVLGAGVSGLKAAWLVCDAALAILVYKLCPSGRRFQSLILYAWSPLVVVEVAWSAHLDLLGVAPLVAALWLGRRDAAGRGAAACALALSAGVKYFAAALVPAAARAARRPWLPVLAFAAVALVLYAPYLEAGGRAFSGLWTFVEGWSFNAGPYRLLLGLLRWPWLAKAAAAAIVTGVVVQSVRNRWTLERAAFWVTGSILMFAPTVHPWYLLWMVPLVALRPSRAWIYLSCSVFLAYFGLGAYRATGTWPQPLWLALIIWGPFALLLIYDAWRGSWLETALEVAVRRGAAGDPEAGSEPKGG